MVLTIGTFNLNNLFSRYNFDGEIEAIQNEDTDVNSEIHYTFKKDDTYKVKTYMGKLVKKKKPKDIGKITTRILDIDVSILAVQEVEDIDTLKDFNRDNLNTPATALKNPSSIKTVEIDSSTICAVWPRHQSGPPQLHLLADDTL